MFKSIFRRARFQNMLAAILAGYMAFIKRTTRWSHIDQHNVTPIWDGGKGVILCIWHGRFLVAHSGWPKGAQYPHVLISQSNDGSFITAAVKRLGLGVIRGSTNRAGSDKDRGGAAALKKMVRHIRKDGCVVITPDGPRGPRMRTGEGPVRLAKMTGAPMLPYALATKNRILFKSWDRFMLPLPFGRGVFVWGEPIMVERKASEQSVKAARALFEQRMIAVTRAADEFIGKDIVEPANMPKLARQNQIIDIEDNKADDERAS